MHSRQQTVLHPNQMQKAMPPSSFLGTEVFLPTLCGMCSGCPEPLVWLSVCPRRRHCDLTWEEGRRVVVRLFEWEERPFSCCLRGGAAFKGWKRSHTVIKQDWTPGRPYVFCKWCAANKEAQLSSLQVFLMQWVVDTRLQDSIVLGAQDRIK